MTRRVLDRPDDEADGGAANSDNSNNNRETRGNHSKAFSRTEAARPRVHNNTNNQHNNKRHDAQHCS